MVKGVPVAATPLVDVTDLSMRSRVSDVIEAGPPAEKRRRLSVPEAAERCYKAFGTSVKHYLLSVKYRYWRNFKCRSQCRNDERPFTVTAWKSAASAGSEGFLDACTLLYIPVIQRREPCLSAWLAFPVSFVPFVCLVPDNSLQRNMSDYEQTVIKTTQTTALNFTLWYLMCYYKTKVKRIWLKYYQNAIPLQP